jgi:amino acid permease
MSSSGRWLKFLQFVTSKGSAGIVALVVITALACVVSDTSAEVINAITWFVLVIILLIIVTYIMSRWEKKADDGRSSPGDDPGTPK